MKNKIALKLTAYFSVTLVLFSIIIGIVFITLFRSNTIDSYKTDLEKRAVSMADKLSGYVIKNSQGKSNINGWQAGYGAYIRFLDDIAMADVWIVDEDLSLITSKQAGKAFNYADLPKNSEFVIDEVLREKHQLARTLVSCLTHLL